MEVISNRKMNLPVSLILSSYGPPKGKGLPVGESLSDGVLKNLRISIY